MKNLKRFFAALLALVLCIGQIPALTVSVYAADETCPGPGNHTRDNCDYTMVHITMPDCGNAGYTSYQCNVCQETFVDDIVAATGDHQWVETEGLAPTCTTPGYEAGKKCSVCGKVVSGALIPALSETATECEWVDLTPYINCETGGIKKYECAFCGATWEAEVKPGQHTWDNANPELIKPATLTESGLAEVTCTTCLAVKEVEVLFTHVHDHKNPAGYIVTYPEVAATCTTTGMKSYMQCRICGAVNFQRMSGSRGTWGWFQLTEAEWATLVIPAAHSFEQAPTCVDNVRTCRICKKTVTVIIDHIFEVWQTQVMPTCTKPGFELSTCSSCGIARETRILPELGHYTVTVEVPATCKSNAYSYTYCTRIGCEDGSVNPEEMYPMTADVFTPVNAISVGEPFYLGMTMATLGTDLYFTGAMDGNYLAASHSINEAVVVYLEIVHPMASNAYRLFFYDAEGVKTYIEIYEHDPVKHRVGVHLTTAPVNTFSWNEELGILTSVVNNTAYYLGSYKTYGNFSASATRYITGSNASQVGVSQFPAYLGAVGEKTDVRVVSYTVEQGSIDASAHNMVSEVVIAPTCAEPGVKQVRCALCGFADMAEIPAGHCWVAMTGELTVEGKTVPAFRAADCEDGWQYYQCSQCQEIQKVIIPGYGHMLSDVVEQNPDHLNTVVYDYQSCIYCGFTVQLTKKVWSDANKHWDTIEAANKAHGGSLTGNGTIIKIGSCDDYGLKLYTCGTCKKAVYVKIAGTGEHVMPEGTAFQAPTCTDKGYIATYVCVRCGTIVGAARLGEKNEIPALGHDWEENGKYKPAACDKPNYANYSHICAVCGVSRSDGTTLLARVEYDNTDPCTSVAFEYYLCHCGEEHMISFITELGHNMVELPRYDAAGKPIAANFKAPTCYETGFTTYVCSFCGLTNVEILAKVEHTNAAGEKFTDKCIDTVTDRHCVVCHDHFDHDALGDAHDCTKLDANKDGILDCLGECMIASSHHWAVNRWYPSTCDMTAYHLMRCADCDYETVSFFDDFTFSGHKPASNLELYYRDENGNVVAHENGPQPTYLAGYIYDDNYVWYSVKVIDGALVQHAEAYTAKYIEYVPATAISDGHMTMYCQKCRQIVEQVLPKTGTEDGGQGLAYTLSEDGTYYIVTDIGSCTDTDLVIPATYKGLPVKEIGKSAFYNCDSLTNVTIPDSVTSVGDDAFGCCTSLTSVTIPSSVTSIGNRVFQYCISVEGIWVNSGNPNYSNDDRGVLFNKDKSVLIQAPGLINGIYAIPSGVTTIGGGAFAHCYSLTGVTIPDSVTSIDDVAFYMCTSLTGITIPDGVTTIGDGAFYECTSLISVTLPDSITSIGKRAFSHCISLTSITFEGDAPTFSSDVFRGVTATAYYPAGNATWTADVMQNYGGTITWVAYETAHYGDANGDGGISLKDVLLLRQYLANLDPETNESGMEVQIGADANGDGGITLKDVLLLRQYLANLDPETGESTVVLGPQ